ncbi:MAG: cysteine desulfurase [Acholeplasmataceae bacterium]|nr:cysteine desulfurase [Acholeplasmataceae bacterium]
MIYFDYAATTPVDERVLERFVDICRRYPGNSNSSHALGIASKNLVSDAQNRIAAHFQLDSPDIIYTSGATEANNLGIIGYVTGPHYPGKHLITTGYEHSSVTACFAKLAQAGYQVDVVESDRYGKVDINALAHLIRPDTLLVSIGIVNGEIGIIQDLPKIQEVLSHHPNTLFHSDVTQAVGKLRLDLSNVDLATFSGHKIYGLKGIGALIKKKNIVLKPLFVGGKSLSSSRPGTPPVPLIHSLADALDNVYDEYDKKQLKVRKLRRLLMQRLKEIPESLWNSNKYCVPEINNISFMGLNAKVLQETLSQQEIYVSTQTACGSDLDFSAQVFRLTNDEKRAYSSIRISLSSLNTPEEINRLAQAIQEAIR